LAWYLDEWSSGQPPDHRDALYRVQQEGSYPFNFATWEENKAAEEAWERQLLDLEKGRWKILICHFWPKDDAIRN
jgi:hypothetical protein